MTEMQIPSESQTFGRWGQPVPAQDFGRWGQPIAVQEFGKTWPQPMSQAFGRTWPLLDQGWRSPALPFPPTAGRYLVH